MTVFRIQPLQRVADTEHHKLFFFKCGFFSLLVSLLQLMTKDERKTKQINKQKKGTVKAHRLW